MPITFDFEAGAVLPNDVSLDVAKAVDVVDAERVKASPDV